MRPMSLTTATADSPLPVMPAIIADARPAALAAFPPPRAGIQSVEVGYTLMAALAAAPGPLMLRDLAAAAGMNAAKAHRYLVSFQRLGLVVQDLASNRYDLGPAALKLGLASISRLDSVKLARQRLPELMNRIGHTLALAVWGNQGPTIVHWEESPRAITVNLRLGDVMPLLSSATGLCFSAFMSAGAASADLHPRVALMLNEELKELIQGNRLARADLPLNLAGVNALLAEVRQRGLARVVGTLLPGVGGFCAPVFDADGHLVLGMVALGSLASFEVAWDGPVAAQLAAAARQLSGDLGFRGA
jgi:DNA-binding IclR family transcriptional regulator